MADARRIAVKALITIEKDGAYSNLAVGEVLKGDGLSPKDKGFVSALVYGVLDRKITLDYIISRFSKIPFGKISPVTLNVLRTALYQILYMDRVPDSAAVNEAVNIIKHSKENRSSGFVNGMLRSVLREGVTLPKGNSQRAMSIKYSCPEWMIKGFIDDYGRETAVALLEESLKTPPVTVRVNTLVTDKEALKTALNNEGICCTDGIADNSLCIEDGINIPENEYYKKGWFFVQDAASQKAVSVLCPQKGSRVLDMCAAPGGKSFLMAMMMENQGEIVSCDLYPHRTELIRRSAERLGLDIIKPVTADATSFSEQLGKFDYILCDVPCSGLGVLRRKPEIKYKEDNDFDGLRDIQLKILCNSVKYLKDKGKILYSTCTLRCQENENLVFSFQKEYNDFRKTYEHSFMPHIDGTDGFYCALLER